MAASFSPDSRYLVTASMDQTARVWDVETGQALTGPLRHGGSVDQAFFADDAGRLLTASYDDTVRLWHLSARRSARPVIAHENEVTELSFTADGRRVMTASGETVQLWDARTGKPSGAPMQQEARLYAVALSPDGQRMVTICADFARKHNKAYLWHIQSQKRKELPLEWKYGPAHSPSFSRDSRRVLICDDSGFFKIWDTTSGELLDRVRHSEKPSGFAILSPIGDRIFTAKPWEGVGIWDVRTQKHMGFSIPDYISNAAISPDSRYLLTTSHGPHLNAQIWDVESGQPRVSPLSHRGKVHHASFSPDGRRVVTASSDQLACVWDAATGRQLAALEHLNAVMNAWFNADGRLIITRALAPNDDTKNEARLWDADTWEALTPPMRYSGYRNRMSFSPDGRVVATAYRDHSVGLWDLSTDERPYEDLVLLAQLLNQQKNRAGQSPETFTTAEVRGIWEKLRAKYPESFTSSSVDDYEWHRHGAEVCERRELWTEAARHLDWLLQAHPGDRSLRVRSVTAHSRSGDSLLSSGQHAAAEADFSAARDLLNGLRNELPASDPFLQQLADLDTKEAEATYQRKDYPKARRVVTLGEEHARAAVTASPTNAKFRATLAKNRHLAAKILIALGEHEPTPKCVADYLEMDNSAQAIYDGACHIALCVPIAQKDEKLPEARRKELAQQYGDRAVALLRQAIEKGWAKEWRYVEWMEKGDTDLNAIRERADFKQCVADLHKKLAPKK
jgi:WD40 repeat protein